MTEIALVGNDNILELDLFKNEAAGTFINSGATMSVTVVDSAGTEVTGQTWPATLSYVAASDGKYRATLEDVAAFVDGSKYTAKITADGGPGLKGFYELPLQGQTRVS